MEQNDTSVLLEWVALIVKNPNAGVIGMVTAVPLDTNLKMAIDKVPEAYF